MSVKIEPSQSPAQGLNATNTLVLSPITIAGLDVIDCSSPSYTYSVPNLISCTYIWTVPNSLDIISGQGTSTVVVARNTFPPSSSDRISVTINDTRGRIRTVIANRNISIGLPNITGLTSYINSCFGGSDWELGLQAQTGNQNITRFIWTKNGVVMPGVTSSTYYTYEFPPSCMSIGVRAVNNCGTGPELIQTFCPPCTGFTMSVSPNPVKNELYITIETHNTSKVNKINSNKFQISLVESTTGQVIKNWTFTEQKQYRLLLNGVKRGNYTIVVKNGNEKTSKQIVIN